METENELNVSILKITTLIRQQYPELSKYIEELPVTILRTKESSITRQELVNYYDSLKAFLNKYILEHPKA